MTKNLLFGSPTCQPCKALKGMLGNLGYEFEYVDCAETPEMAAKYGVMSTPTLIKVDENGETIKRVTGQGAAFAMAQEDK
ncbi:thioredoxin family protein [Mammaliicoccus sp. E-M24]|uniref:thioredoxin family protein n=1 Tax=Mammaliicoccus sp. E-M24 TaxID=2898684 RepID=UPI001EFA460D|nr:thioredoxin family protein [Mammaliicoccus sp. E-M24]